MTKILSKDDSRHTKDDSRHTIENNMESNYIKKYQCVIPAEAFVTTDYREFCRIIKDRFIDTTHVLQYLIKKVEIEKNILRTKSTELIEREKKIIRDYINKVENDICSRSKVRNLLYKLVNSEKRLSKVFNNRKNTHSKIEYKNT
jgi:hypothetical protein